MRLKLQNIVGVLCLACFNMPMDHAFAQQATAEPVDFNRQIRPILSRHCLACHGPDEHERAADLRLDNFAGATDYVIVPGAPEESEFLARITSLDDPMPPAEHGERLSDQQIELLTRWIAEGSKYEVHWSFQPIEQPALPTSPHTPWARNAIDHFVANRWSQNLLTANPEADSARLIRRLALDLTGLPPTADMVGRFVGDPSDTVYESIVDELLASPSYGEHWASMWLDLARYADTVGYASDENRTIWPWRDWLIRALNDNMPFDQFTIEMLAGDLLPNATPQQKLATAFHRNTLNNNEGGTNNEEFRVIAVKDRLSTTLNTWMGLTVRCAECHSHKYDPISHKEYYQLLDFFNQTADADRGDEQPTMELTPQLLLESLEQIDRQITDTQQQIDEARPVWRAARPHSSTSLNGTQFRALPDESILATGINPDHETYSFTFDNLAEQQNITGLKIEFLPSTQHNGHVGRSREGNIVLSQVLVYQRNDKQVGARLTPIALSYAAADHSQAGYTAEHVIRPEIADRDEPLGWAIYHGRQGYRRTRTLVISFDKSNLPSAGDLRIDLVFNSNWHHRNAGRMHFSFTTVNEPAEKFADRSLQPLKAQLTKLIVQRNQSVRVPIMQQLPKNEARQTHVMRRGDFRSPEELVTAATPRAFPTFPQNASQDRLGLAQWILDDTNPLTTRVTVNRYWARLFGRGLVVTEEDFGTQGVPPTHPQLLDWLATDFRQQGWDTKKLLKLLVMSSTYRQSNFTDASAKATDPNNLWLARGPRKRLPAETIRDQALAVAGLLSDKQFGRPVFPPNPIKEVTNAFAGSRVWKTSQGPDRYRRALYTFLRRSQPHPLLETFDLATRDVCSLRRINTNTPLQAFMTLNGQGFIEAAQSLAVKMQQEETPRAQVALGLQTALLQRPDRRKIIRLETLYQQTLAAYSDNPELASDMIGRHADETPIDQRAELAALTVVANVILNLDEFLTN